MTVLRDLGFPFTDENGDRLYAAQDWRTYFDALVVGGVVGDIANELQVKPQASPNKSIVIDTGAVLINGAMRKTESTITLAIADNASGNPRIDRIVARLNYTDRKIEFVVKQGTPAGSPSAPALTRGASVYELSLARIAVANGYTTITAGNITDERLDEAVCGYFKYRAKPAWYPGGSVPYDAWMYNNFKNQLTAGEITDIEANSGLMAIINGGNMKLANNRIKSLARFKGLEIYTASSATISTNTNLTSPINVYDNLTIDAGATLIGVPNTTLIYVKGTLTLNGTISATGKGGAGGNASNYAGAGGNAGGVLIVMAKKIIGTGSIRANGTNGGNTAAGSASGTGQTNGTAGKFRDAAAQKSMAALTVEYCLLSDIGGGGGQSGRTDDASTYLGAGGIGGDGVIGAGGGAQSGTVPGNTSSPGGGGGGGAVVIISDEPIPALTLQAIGGNAGSIVSQIYANAAGGGGGGLISILAPSTSATTSVVGGTGGAAGHNGSPGGNGTAGLVEFFAIDAA
jgi:hypothetical protein